jgi:hypothetical protein
MDILLMVDWYRQDKIKPASLCADKCHAKYMINVSVQKI